MAFFLFLLSGGCFHLGLCIFDTGARMAQGSSEGFLLFQWWSLQAISSDALRAIARGKDLKRGH